MSVTWNTGMLRIWCVFTAVWLVGGVFSYYQLQKEYAFAFQWEEHEGETQKLALAYRRKYPSDKTPFDILVINLVHQNGTDYVRVNDPALYRRYKGLQKNYSQVHLLKI